jgi:two-component system cell cycle response regulator
MPARILVIEDNPANLELMMYLLRAFGHTAYAAKDGEEGLQKAASERPDLIICDIQLPKIDGNEVVRQLKSDPETQGIPVIAVTALAMVGDRDRVLQAGFDGYLAKPIDPEAFIKQLDPYLSGHSSAAFVSGSVTIAPRQFGKAATVLAVDNVPANLDLAHSLLGPFGYSVVTASGGHEGLEKARRERPDLILSDICMADGSGFELIQSVKADAKLASIPFVFITSTMMDERDRAKGLSLGAARFLFRPIEPERLLAEIAACLIEAGHDG